MFRPVMFAYLGFVLPMFPFCVNGIA
jgi:hypothetical protein